MSATRCAHCTSRVRDGSLCQRGGRELIAALASVPALLADLTIMRSGGQRLAPATGRVHQTATPRIPIQLTPKRHGAPVLRGDRELARLTRAVMHAAALLGVDAAGPVPHPGLVQLVHNNRHASRGRGRDAIRMDTPPTIVELAAIWCVCHPADLRAHPDAGDAWRKMRDAIAAVHFAIDPQRRRYLGPCTAEIRGPGDTLQPCGAGLMAAAGRPNVKCRRCRTVYVVADLTADALRRAEDAVWTAAELIDHVLPSIGVHIPRPTLYRWLHRHQIPPRGYQGHDGRITTRRIRVTDAKVYRLGDVLDAAAREDAARTKGRPA